MGTWIRVKLMYAQPFCMTHKVLIVTAENLASRFDLVAQSPRKRKPSKGFDREISASYLRR